MPYLKYWDVNNLYRWPMSQMVPVNNFKWVEHISEFEEKYFLEIDIQYHENLHQTQSNLLFLLERMKIEKVEKLVANLHGKSECELKNNSVFGKTVKNVWKHRNVRLVTIERRRNYLISEPNYHSKKIFIENLLAREMRKTQILMKKSVSE